MKYENIIKREPGTLNPGYRLEREGLIFLNLTMSCLNPHGDIVYSDLIKYSKSNTYGYQVSGFRHYMTGTDRIVDFVVFTDKYPEGVVIEFKNQDGEGTAHAKICEIVLDSCVSDLPHLIVADGSHPIMSEYRRNFDSISKEPEFSNILGVVSLNEMHNYLV